ncbi:uncharacterized protein K02A2.6-like [Sycon ciliatum]|uniref:uncharacterized protein K02A2.6-like n=1 Tax=Sycon ciliatum TaxID=27933 RepID=UPI0031F71C9B
MTRTSRCLSTIFNIHHCPVSERQLNEIRLATQQDPSLTKLMHQVMSGWPDTPHLVLPEIRPYFSYRDEITAQDGLLLRGERIGIPLSMRNAVKIKANAGHMAVNSCIWRDRDLVYWPGMSSEISLFVENCETCARHTSKKQPETLFLHPVPDRPWQKVGIDIFTIKSRNYLVTVDYLSNFYEVDFLPDTLASTCISKIKYHFARHGIPDVVVSNNDSQFSCREFSAFAAKWEFSHERSSPGNSKSNGVAEAAVKEVLKFMNKCNEEKSNPYLGLLNVRNTPTESLRTSPVQRLFGRRTRTVLPALNDHLKPAADT